MAAALVSWGTVRDTEIVAGHEEPHADGLAGRLNRLRAAVLGANDGIVSEAGLVVGVAAATTDRTALLVAGLAGLVAGAVSMALGEYVSVSSQRDAETALVEKERRELAETPEAELAELAAIYRGKGLQAATADQVARELTEHDALAAHLEAELHLDQDDLVSPSQAALASALAFVLGAALPLLAILFTPIAWRVPVTVLAVLAALALTGATSARLAGGDPRRAVLRIVLGGAAGLAATYGIGVAFGVGLG
ncbi:MAG: VIT family protein [Geodermatophilaceae bacterium]|nr:VIT family protein [Geodermatophilaceae bacterium]MDQ3455551.1 VIT family protein [Actinomycetota bacterium]